MGSSELLLSDFLMVFLTPKYVIVLKQVVKGYLKSSLALLPSAEDALSYKND